MALVGGGRNEAGERRPRVLARRSLAGAVGLALLGSLVVGLAADAGAASGPGTMSATPTKAVAGAGGASFTFSYVAPKSTTISGTVLLQVPPAWTAPRTSKGIGHVAVKKHSCTKASLGPITAAKPRTVAVTVSCHGGKGFTLSYSKVAVATTAAAYPFPATLKAKSKTTPLTSSPTITVTAATLSYLVVSPPTGTTGYVRNDGTGTDDFTIQTGHAYVAYTANGYDKYHNLIGDVTAQTTFTVGLLKTPCLGDMCGAPGQGGPWSVDATDGAATGSASVTGDVNLDTMTCRGLNFDVNQNVLDGCETPQLSTGTTQGSATSLGQISCNDGNGHTVQATGDLASDVRVHQNPVVAGFDTAVGAAPSWWSIDATGGTLCSNDVVLTITVTGAADPTCYAFTVFTDLHTFSVQVGPTGTAGRPGR